MGNPKKVAVIGSPSIGSTLAEHLQKESDTIRGVVVYEPKGKPDRYSVDEAFNILQDANRALGRDLAYTEAVFINTIVKRDTARIVVKNGAISVELVFPDLDTGSNVINRTLLTDEQKQAIAEAAANHKETVRKSVDIVEKIKGATLVKKSGQQLRRERRASKRKSK